MSDKQQPTAVTLDSVEKTLETWRANKSQYPNKGIPNEIWLQIFSLETPFRSPSQLRAIFKLNSQQYQKKYVELIKGNTKPEAQAAEPVQSLSATVNPEPAFAEVFVENKTIPPLSPELQATKDTLKAIKKTRVDLDELLDPTTVVVECIRSDGQRLKIHTCSQRIDTIIQAFYSQAMST